ncbi:MAG: hypothetical protein ABS58_05180 [Mesorhizobium sp. SCN 65-20]|nr:MAG: hypothetical protein ABS58_05180 [Mesorhizobium sp. SCN 65-20]
MLTLLGCVSPQIDPEDPGEVSGYLMVFWVGEDKFVYYPYYSDPLTYRLPASQAKRVGAETIRPGAIYTDGGSIPRAVRNWTGFSPWGYGPAYIVHDWLFIARHCILNNRVELHDRRDRAEVDKVRNVDFQLSADMLASVIQALVKQEKVPARGFAPSAIYGAVESGVARRLWDSRDPASCSPPSREVIAEIERKIRAGVERAVLPDTTGGPVLVYQQRF